MTHLSFTLLPAWLVLAVGLGLHTGAAVAAPASLSDAEARHLLMRTGFAPTQAEVDRLVGQDAARVIDQLLAQARAARPLHPPPAFVTEPSPPAIGSLKTREEQQAARQQQYREGFALKTWWLREMIETASPLTERMTLFWHNHFATSQLKVVRSQAMWRQQLLLRENALGNFRTLLQAVARDPAMLVYLDGANSRRQSPNENFAREVMELFVLGEASRAGEGLGGYTEQDIREAARAFTGWSVDREDFSFRFRPQFHDSGSKTVFGHTANLSGEQVLDLMLAQPASARFVVGKLWREWVSPGPQTAAEQADLARAAARFRDSGFEISAALRELLLSDSFWAKDNRASLIKSPVDLVVGTVRQFGFNSPDVAPLAVRSAQLGQNLLVPPNVKGWPGYTDWINATRLLERKRFTEQLFRAGDARVGTMNAAPAMANESMLVPAAAPAAPQLSPAMALQSLARFRFDPDSWLQTYGAHPDREPSEPLKSRLAQVVLGASATQSIADGTVGLAYLRALTLDPAYQLK